MEHMPGMNMPPPAPAPAPAPAQSMPDMPGMDMPGMDMGSAAPAAQQPYCTHSMTMNMDGYAPVTKEQTLRPCLTFLVQSAVIDSPAKYAGAVVGAFLIAFAAEMVQLGRAKVRRSLRGPWVETKRGRVAKASIEALLFGVQMSCAYACMLLVMSYDSLLASAVLAGLVGGYFVNTLLRAGGGRGDTKAGTGLQTEDVSIESSGGKGAPRGDDCCELGYLGGDEHKSA